MVTVVVIVIIGHSQVCSKMALDLQVPTAETRNSPQHDLFGSHSKRDVERSSFTSSQLLYFLYMLYLGVLKKVCSFAAIRPS